MGVARTARVADIKSPPRRIGATRGVVIQPLERNGFVIDHVPAEVCHVWGDPPAGGLAPETVGRIEALLAATAPPLRTVPLYEFA